MKKRRSNEVSCNLSPETSPLPKKKTSPIQHLPLSPTNTLLPLNGREFVRLGPLSESVKQRVPYPWTSPDTSGYLRFARLAFAGSGNSSLRQRPTPLIRHPGSGGDFLSIASFCRIAAHWGKSVSKKESANALDRLVADKRHWEDSCSGAEVPPEDTINDSDAKTPQELPRRTVAAHSLAG